MGELEEKRGFVLKIYEYGCIVRQYHDTDYDRFMMEVKDIITKHLETSCKQVGLRNDEVKNIQFSIYTY